MRKSEKKWEKMINWEKLRKIEKNWENLTWHWLGNTFFSIDPKIPKNQIEKNWEKLRKIEKNWEKLRKIEKTWPAKYNLN